MSLEKDQAFFRNFSIVVIILAAMMVVFLVAAIMVGNTISYGGKASADAQAREIAERTAPVGDVRLEGEAPPARSPVADSQQVAAADEPKSGKAVYESTCATCHAGTLPGAPALGKADDWAPRIAKGMDTLYKHAIEGFQGEGGMMPAKGGNTSLSDEEVKAAVDYMVENSQ